MVYHGAIGAPNSCSTKVLMITVERFKAAPDLTVAFTAYFLSPAFVFVKSFMYVFQTLCDRDSYHSIVELRYHSE